MLPNHPTPSPPLYAGRVPANIRPLKTSYIYGFINHPNQPKIIIIMSKKPTSYDYPEIRKTRDTSYSETWKLVHEHGLNTIKDV